MAFGEDRAALELEEIYYCQYEEVDIVGDYNYDDEKIYSIRFLGLVRMLLSLLLG